MKLADFLLLPSGNVVILFFLLDFFQNGHGLCPADNAKEACVIYRLFTRSSYKLRLIYLSMREKLSQR